MQASIVQVGILVGVMVKEVLAVMPIKEMVMQLLALVSTVENVDNFLANYDLDISWWSYLWQWGNGKVEVVMFWNSKQLCTRVNECAVVSSVVCKLGWDVLRRMDKFGPFIFVVPLLLRLDLNGVLRQVGRQRGIQDLRGGRTLTVEDFHEFLFSVNLNPPMEIEGQNCWTQELLCTAAKSSARFELLFEWVLCIFGGLVKKKVSSPSTLSSILCLALNLGFKSGMKGSSCCHLDTFLAATDHGFSWGMATAMSSAEGAAYKGLQQCIETVTDEVFKGHTALHKSVSNDYMYEVDLSLPFVLATYPKVSSPRGLSSSHGALTRFLMA
ncbi:hypothetical protein RHSIM_Rhsim01G0135100 [Rhododendron simsii]|uniref:Uncharacterized protein n=1 Tax=Rhododendron simsii TaxID=118357 RepID=A0A834LYP1_RHOSS|nr:hypothetical protein RHSIM_Rhsim01G0135100 [Rhododendron simsii]